MEDIDRQFYDDLTREDDLGLILRGLLHIEHQLIELCSVFMPCASQCDWGAISYRAKVELAHGFGLSSGLKDIFLKLGSIRNKFAHELSAQITAKQVLDLYNLLPPVLSGAVAASYESLGRADQFSPSKMPPQELLVLILLSSRQSAKIAIQLARGQV